MVVIGVGADVADVGVCSEGGGESTGVDELKERQVATRTAVSERSMLRRGMPATGILMNPKDMAIEKTTRDLFQCALMAGGGVGEMRY